MLKGIPRLRTAEDLMRRAENPADLSPKEKHLFLLAHSKLSPAEQQRITIALAARKNTQELMSPPANSADTLSAPQSEHQF